MEERPKGYGMTAELNAKKEEKYDADLANETFQWIEAVVEEPVSFDGQSDSVVILLKDGQILCKLMNILRSNNPQIKYNQSKMAFKQMENISKFLDGCEQLGVAKTDSFQTVDLYEGQNVPQVINGIGALARKASALGLTDHTLGPKESDVNKREFTKEQLDAGKHIIGLQAGSNKGATQAGQSFGSTRQIIGQ